MAARGVAVTAGGKVAGGSVGILVGATGSGCGVLQAVSTTREKRMIASSANVRFIRISCSER